MPCSRCGAPMAEEGFHAALARCKFCGNTEPLPEEQAERIRFLRLRLMQLRRAAQEAEAPAATVLQIKQTWGSYVPCVLVFGLLPMLSPGTLDAASFAFGMAERNPTIATLVAMVGHLLPIAFVPAVVVGIVVGYAAMMAVFRRAVEPLLSARPPLSPTGRARCRCCGGELVVTPAPSVVCSYCQASNLLGEELTRERARLLEREAAEYRSRAHAFGKAMATPFKGPAHAFYLWGGAAALAALGIALAGSVVAALML